MRYGLYFLLVLLLVLSGCDRYVDTKNPVSAIPESPPVPTNIQVFVSAQSLSLEWTVTDMSNIAMFRIYIADTLPQNFRAIDSSVTTSTTLSNLLFDRTYYIRIAAVTPAGLEGDPSEIISAAIGYTSLIINAGAQYTIGRDVIISLNSSVPASQIILSEDPTFADAYFIPWAPERGFTLSPGDGLKVVYGRMVFSDGSESAGTLEDGIVLDTRAEIGSVSIAPSGVTFAAGNTVTFGVDAGELFGRALVSFPGVERVDLFDNGSEGDDVANDGVYHGQYVVPVNTNLFEGIVTGQFTDAAGNAALPVTASEVLNINTPPAPVNLALTLNPLNQLEFTWTVSLEPDFQSYRLYSSSTSPVLTTSTLVATIPDPLVSIYVATPNVTTRYYRIFVYDQHGAVAGSNERVYP